MDYLKYEDDIISYSKVINQRKQTCLHYHDNNELYYLIRGKTKYFVGDETFVIEEGNLIFIPSQMLHSNDSEDTLHNERILLNIPNSFFDETTMAILNELKKCKFIYIPSANLYMVDELFNKINNEYSKGKKHSSLLIKLYILELLTLLCRFKKDYVPKTVQTDDIIRDIAEYIRQNFDAPITLEHLGKHFAISGAYLSRRFKVVLGIGLSDYITYVRITNAEKLLTETNMPITKIAAACGFNDSNYFASVFKRLKGITPYKFSKSAQKRTIAE